jgi:hypothetical protein
MKSYNTIILTIVLLPLIFSCEFLEEFEKGNGEYVTERRTVSDFDELKIGGNFEVFLKKEDQSYVEIHTDENLLQFIDSEVRGNILEITQRKKLISKRKIKLTIAYSDLHELRAMGAALIKNQGHLETTSLTIRMEGAGIVDLKIQCDDLEVVVSGAGIVKLAGEVNTQDLSLTGAGKLEAFDLESASCTISVGGIGGAEIYVTEKLDATIEGIGGIEYAGEPAETVTEINGLGKIEQVDFE